MVHKKYTYKKGKRYGPYLYETKRVDGKIITTYLGRHVEEKKISKRNYEGFFALSVLLALLLLFILFPINLTGKASLDIKAIYNQGEEISGDLKLVLTQGELIPSNSKIVVTYAGVEKEFLLSELVDSAETFSGVFYAENFNILGNGEGYGLPGEYFPEVVFQLLVFDSGDDGDSFGGGGGSDSGSESSGGGVSGAGSSGEEVAEESNETRESAGGEINETEEIEEEEQVAEEPKASNETGEQVVEEVVEEITEGIVEEQTGPVEGSGESNDGSANPDSSYDSGIDFDSSGAGITGGAIFENEFTVSGVVRRGEDFTYTLENGQSARIVSGSVKANEEKIDESNLDLSINGRRVTVSTDYFINGFGPDFTGEDFLILPIGLEKFGFVAENSSDFSAALIYEGETLIEVSKDISVVGDEDFEEEIVEEVFEENKTVSGELFDKVIIIDGTTPINVSANTTQFGAVLGEPVKWVKKINVDGPLSISVEIPFSAENVLVKKIKKEKKEDASEVDETESEKEEVVEESNETEGSVEEEAVAEELEEPEEFEMAGEVSEIVEIESQEENTEGALETADVDIKFDITGDVSADLDFSPEESVIVKLLKRIFRFTGFVVTDVSDSETWEIIVEINESEGAVEVEFETPAPYAIESESENGKTVKIVGPDSVHYENVLSYTNLNENLSVTNPSRVKIYWEENGSYISPLSVLDLNSNGFYDYVEWIAPHLSNQTFSIIFITKAEHLDANRDFISDIYNETRELDGVWSEVIPDGDYVRVTFEIPLDSTRDITLYPRTVSGTPKIEVYEIDGNETIASFESIVDDEYNKVFLDGSSGAGLGEQTQDTFDLRVVGGDVEIEYIVDPATTGEGLMVYGTTSTSQWFWRYVNPDGTYGAENTYTNGLGATTGDMHMVSSPTNSSEMIVLYSDFGGSSADSTEGRVAVFNNASQSFATSTQLATDLRQGNAKVGKPEPVAHIAYEYQTGEALVVYARAAGVYYRTWDGTWSAEQTYGTTQSAFGLHLASDPGSDKIMLAYVGDDGSFTVFSNVWDGTSWGTEQNWGASAHSNNKQGLEATAAFEGTSGDGMVVFVASGPTVKYANYTGSSDSWSASAATPAPATYAGGKSFWITAMGDSHENHDYIGVMTESYQSKIPYGIVWDGNAWESSWTSVLSGGQGNGKPYDFDLDWENTTSPTLHTLHSPKSGTGMRWKQWTTAGWGTTTSLPGTTATLKWGVDIATDRGSDSLMAIGGDGTSKANHYFWDRSGGTWGSSSTVSTSSNYGKLRQFAVGFFDGSNAAGGGASDTEYPIFSTYTENPVNNTAYVSGAAYEFNATITSTNGTVQIDFNNTNYTVSNVSATVFNITFSTDLAAGTYNYYWWAKGNGTDNLFNRSADRSYTVSKATGNVEVYLNASAANFTGAASGDFVVSNASVLAGEIGAAVYNDSTLIANMSFSTNNTYFAGPASQNITAILAASQNYTRDSQERWIDGVLSNTAPTDPTPEINSTDGTNRTAQNLNCIDVLDDIDAGDTMDVTVKWFNGTVDYLTADFNNSYANGTLFSALLNYTNTTKGENWSCAMRVFDGTAFSAWVNSTNITIVNTPPSIPTLSTPTEGTNTTNRAPNFAWNAATDDDAGDSITYELNVSLVATSACTEADRYIDQATIGGATSYQLSGDLQCFYDNLDFYNWTVRAYDGTSFSGWQNPFAINTSSSIVISLPNNSVEFGQLAYLGSDNTTDDSPLPFLIQNDGNAISNITIEATNLWSLQANPTQFYQYKIDNYTLENFSYTWPASVTTFTNVPASGSPVTAIADLNYSNATDTAEIDINVTVPVNEPPGVRSSTVTFTASLAEG